MVQMYKCDICGNIFIVGYNAGPVPVCCGQPMRLITANTEEAAFEKHIPCVTVDGDTVDIMVGEVPHPMTEPHYIASIMLETDRSLLIKYNRPTDEPKTKFIVPPGEKPVAAYEYCNLHGLWSAKV